MFRRTEVQLQAMASLMRSPGGQLFWEMLVSMAQEKDREARKLDGPALYRAQGQAEAYEQLANDMQSALSRRPEPVKLHTAGVPAV